ncbi:regulatory iron-sulfur-containing complex subunit RicT [Saprospiraceae bacterium]|nr:regulatory iron-sulfur-containing complex subunit RicT [Saprospiraceae bacterium]
MACGSCSGTNGVSKGCGNKGNCGSGSCNKLNTFDWLAQREIPVSTAENIVEISFKNGARKDFFFMDSNIQVVTGDMVVVNSGNGYDVGRLSLSGDLVTLQMKKKRVTKERVLHNVTRKANDRDLEKLKEARELEMPAMVRARAISRTLELDMKVGDVEYQGDKRKATFYYTAEGRVDFRELVRAYAKEFKVKVEMRQIGSRQESARIGGIGSCGRELCCSTWLTDFKSVSTTAARYQYMAINQSKLSGQCGRLKCCLNFELDSYMDALSGFPEKADYLKTKDGSAKLMKIDIFKGIMYYSVSSKKGRGPIVAMDKEDVKKVVAMNKAGEFPHSMAAIQEMAIVKEEEEFQDYEDVTGAVELPSKSKGKGRSSRSKGRSGNRRGKPQGKTTGRKPKGEKPNAGGKPTGSNKPAGNAPSKDGKPAPKKKFRRRPNKNKANNKPDNNKPS